MCGTTSELRKAIRAGDAARVKELLDQAGPSAADLINEDQSFDCLLDWCARSQQHPLLTALYYPKEKQTIITYLVQYGADLNVEGTGSRSPIHIAARADNVELVTLFLENGADINAKDATNRSVLHYSVGAQGSITSQGAVVMRYLIEKHGFGGHINDVDDSGNTPLHLAAKIRSMQAVECLINHGADPLQVNRLKESALSLANDDNELLTLLQKERSA